MRVRRLDAERDAEPTARIYFDAVRLGAREHYTREELRAWAPSPPALEAWRERLAAQDGWVAVARSAFWARRAPVGFMTLADEGYIDLAFVAPGFARRGVGAALYAALEREARMRATPLLWTMASRVARPFFAQRGFEVARANVVERGRERLENFQMVKALADGD